MAPIRPLAWELTYASGAAPKDKKDKKTKKKNIYIYIYFSWGSSCFGAIEMNSTSIHENVGSLSGLAQWVKDPALP